MPLRSLMLAEGGQAMSSTIVKISAATGLAVLGLAGCGVSGHPAAAPTVTHTVIEWKARVITTPAPAVTVTKTPAISSPSANSGANQIIARFNGSGTQTRIRE